MFSTFLLLSMFNLFGFGATGYFPLKLEGLTILQSKYHTGITISYKQVSQIGSHVRSSPN